MGSKRLFRGADGLANPVGAFRRSKGMADREWQPAAPANVQHRSEEVIKMVGTQALVGLFAVKNSLQCPYA